MPSNNTKPLRKNPQKPPVSQGKYREQYGVIVLCEGEKDQARIYESLRARGFNCRVVVT